MTPVRFHPRALAELTDAASFLAQVAPGLREAFLHEIEAAEGLLRGAPAQAGSIPKELRTP